MWQRTKNFDKCFVCLHLPGISLLHILAGGFTSVANDYQKWNSNGRLIYTQRVDYKEIGNIFGLLYPNLGSLDSSKWTQNLSNKPASLESVASSIFLESKRIRAIFDDCSADCGLWWWAYEMTVSSHVLGRCSTHVNSIIYFVFNKIDNIFHCVLLFSFVFIRKIFIQRSVWQPLLSCLILALSCMSFVLIYLRATWLRVIFGQVTMPGYDSTSLPARISSPLTG